MGEGGWGVIEANQTEREEGDSEGGRWTKATQTAPSTVAGAGEGRPGNDETAENGRTAEKPPALRLELGGSLSEVRRRSESRGRPRLGEERLESAARAAGCPFTLASSPRSSRNEELPRVREERSPHPSHREERCEG